MNYEVGDLDDFLDHVDEWKFKVHEELKNLTPAQRAEYWKKARQEARKLGLTAPEPEPPAKRPAKRRRRATG